MNHIEEEATDKLRSLQTMSFPTESGNSSTTIDDKILSIQNWLCKYPEETIHSIRKLQLTKYDIAIVNVIEQIGSPIADQCSCQLIELLVDLNWPVFKPALSVVFRLSEDALIMAIDDLVSDECFREVDAFCWHAIQIRPVWLQKLKPFLDVAIKKVTQYATDSSIVHLYNELDESPKS